MYAVVKDNRSSNKYYINSRRVPQALNKCDSFDNSIKKDAETLQAKEPFSKSLIKNLMKTQAECQMSSQHEEMARYISSSWTGIKQELESNESNAANASNSTSKSQGKIHYLSSTSTPKNFVPFDLESFWRERILQNLLGSA